MSVYKDPRSQYFTYDFQIGGRTYKGPTKETSKTATKQFERLEKERIRTLPAEPEPEIGAPILLKQAANRYYEEKKNSSEGASLKHDLAEIVQFFGDDKTLNDLTGEDVSRLVDWKKTQFRWGQEKYGLVGPGRVNRSTIQLLQRVVLRAVEAWGSTVKKMPIWGNYKLKEPGKRKRRLSGDEHTGFLETMDEDYIVLMQFSLITGLRQKAALLEWKNVNFGAQTYGYVNKGGSFKERRMTPEAEKILRSRQGHHDKAVFTYVAKRGRHNVRVKGKRYPITVAGLDSCWGRAKDKLSIEGLRWHDLRRTFASNLLKKTKNLALVQNALDHSDPATTLRYAFVEDDDLLEGMADAEGVFASKFQVPAQLEYHPEDKDKSVNE